MEQLIAIIGVLVFITTPFALAFYLAFRRRKKQKEAFEALSEQEKLQLNEKKNEKARNGLNLLAGLIGAALAKSGVIGWGSALFIAVGMMALIWLTSKILSRKKKL